MPRKKTYITVTDQFCGAGGSSQGVRRVSERIKGVEVKLALNHWKLAIETHNTNFPDTIHECTDISACDPRRYPSTDILITSPECTNHSLAKGIKQVRNQLDMFDKGICDPAAERSRATMWDVCRFAEYHNYNVIIVENVVDARKWVLFSSWLNAMYNLGYDHKCVYLNSQHCHPTPQSRDRMYIVFWKRGNKVPYLDYTPLAYCVKCGKDVNSVQSWKQPTKQFGKYKQQYLYCCPSCSGVVDPYYYASFNCIDWSDIGTRIGDRRSPLSDNTVRRIEYGLKKYGSQPLLLHALYGKEARGVVRPISQPSFTQTTLPTQALFNPFIINDQHSTGIDCRVRSVADRIGTIPTQHHYKLIIPPFIIKGEHSHGAPSGKVKSSLNTFQTQTTRQSMGVVYAPFIVENKGQSKSKPVTSPIGCMTSKDYHGIITHESFNSFISYYYGQNQASHITNALGTVTTKDRHQLVTYNSLNIEDCYYRMIKAAEVKLAMAFDQDYIVLGSSKDQVKQLGNAVTPPAMEWLVAQCIESLN